MKRKVILLLSFILLSFMAIAVINLDKEDEVVLTPHQKVSLLPAPNIIHTQEPLSTSNATMLRGSNAYGDNLQYGNMYSFNTDDPSLVNVIGAVDFMALCGDFSPGDNEHIWIIDNNDQFLKRINISTLIASEIVALPCPLPDGIWSCLPINKTTGQFYAIATNGLMSVLYEVDATIGTTTELFDLGITAAISASFDMSNNLYVFDIDTDQMFVVDVFGITSAPLGLAGFDGNYAQGMGLDPNTDQVYLAAYEEAVGPQLRLLDKITGATTLIAALPGETGAFGFSSSESSDDFYTVPQVYESPNIVAGDTIIVEGYYTNPEVALLFENYGDALKDEPSPIHAYLILEGVLPPEESWNGGYIFVRGVISFANDPYPYYPEDPREAIIDVLEVAVFFDGLGLTPDSNNGLEPIIKPINNNTDACDPCKFAILISGGISAKKNPPKYWKNLSALYDFKVSNENYCPENVIVHYYDGNGRDGTIPQARISPANKDSIEKSFNDISSRVAECYKQGKPATFQKLITNHGASNGDICLLGNQVLEVDDLKDMQEEVIDSCTTVYEEFLHCYAGYAVDAMRTMDNPNNATIYVNSNVDKISGWSNTEDVHSYLAAKIAALAAGESYPEAVNKAKLGYDEYLKTIRREFHNNQKWFSSHPPGNYTIFGKTKNWTQHELDSLAAKSTRDSISAGNGICKATNVTVRPMEKYCDWQQYVVPPGGHLALDFEGGSGNCGNVSIYRGNKTNKIGEWNWNLPGSARYQPGFDHRIINGDEDESTIFWVHNDNGAYTITGSANGGSAIATDFNPLSYVGNSAGGNDNSYIEFSEVTDIEVWIEDLDMIPFSMQNLPAFMGPDYTAFLGGNFFVDPTDIYASQIELHLDIVEVFQPGILHVNSSGSTGMVEVEIMESGEYDITLGDLRNDDPIAFIEFMAYDVAFSIDCWGIHSVYQPDIPEIYAGPDITMSSCESVLLEAATATNFDALEWTSSGDGEFDNPTLLNPTYFPGDMDCEMGSVELCLTAMPLPPWPNPETDCLSLSIEQNKIVVGEDLWMVLESVITFGEDGDYPALPIDFFGPGSEAFEGVISLAGANSNGSTTPHDDLRVQRMTDIEFSQPYPSLGSAEVLLDGLNLMSREPVLVHSDFGVDSFFDVFVELNYTAPPAGDIQVSKFDPYGGDFELLPSFYPVITFVPLEDRANTIVFDPFALGMQPLTFTSPDMYSWTHSPIPNEFDPIGEDPYLLLTDAGSTLELLPLLMRNDFASLTMNGQGEAVSWGGTGYNDGEWYEYPNYGWWNVWFYDHPFDDTREKIITMTFEIEPFNADMPVDVTVVYNYSTPNWPGWPEMPRPPLPEDVPTIEIEDEMIGRTETIYEFQGTIGIRETITNEFVIEDFNPEWLSIDVMGSNFMLNADIQHVCFKTPPVEPKDFGDAPDDPYPTLLTSDGARHLSDGVLYLGTKIDVEPDGQPTVAADGDDLNNLDDEDGVVFRTPFVAGEDATIKVLASVDGFLNVWLDINQNGFWGDASDHVFVDHALVAGWNTLILPIPDNAKQGNTYIRFRFDSQGGLNYYGPAENGEVEDYLVKVYPENWGFIYTPVTHTVLVPLNVALNGLSLSANDAIGVFFDDSGVEVCGGAAIWDGTNNQVVLAYGDDNTTPAVKEGFDDGEVFTWRVYHASTGIEEVVSVQYNPAMPQSDGKFVSYGLSGLLQMNGLTVTATANPISLCQGDDVQLDVIISGGSGSYTFSWTSTPPGFTSNIKNPTDIPNQDITYHVTVTDGGASASSSVDVAVQLGPYAFAGTDLTICETDVATLSGSANNSSSVAWTSSGDGVIINPNLPNASYTPGPTDIANGSATLTFTAYPIAPCMLAAIDDLILTIISNPTVSAGTDLTICETGIATLSGSATQSSSVAWTSSGDGVFNNPASFGTIYTPGNSDKLQGFVNLCLEALPISPCQVSVTDCIILTILESQTVHLHEGWNGLSSYLTPHNSNDNYALFNPVIGNLIVAYNFGGSFWPGNTNTLNWVDHSGYVVKMSADDDMVLCGDRISNLVINLNPNWNIVPVLADHDVDVSSVFDSQVDFKMVMEVANYYIYWPAYGINTIGNMLSGKSYFAFMNSADAIDFGNASPKASPIVPRELVNTSPWNDVANSPAGHVVAFSANACNEFKPGDMVGAFTSSGLCVGMINVESQSIGLRVNGDDPYTPQIDGFANDEIMTYRLYRPESGEQFNLNVVYDDKLDNSGRYHDFALSAITDVKMAPTGIYSLTGADIRIYPNPSHGVFNVDGISAESQIIVYDAFGSLIYSKTTHKPMAINLSAQPAGIYLIQIQTLNGTHYQKIIIN